MGYLFAPMHYSDLVFLVYSKTNKMSSTFSTFCLNQDGIRLLQGDLRFPSDLVKIWDAIEKKLFNLDGCRQTSNVFAKVLGRTWVENCSAIVSNVIQGIPKLALSFAKTLPTIRWDTSEITSNS